MGQCYSVQLRIKVRDEAAAIAAIKSKIQADENPYEYPGIRYNLDRRAGQGIDINSFEGLIHSVYGSWDKHFEIKHDEDNWFVFTSDFDTCYGWEWVMIDMFEVFAPFLEDESYLIISPDCGYDELVVRNGKAVQIH